MSTTEIQRNLDALADAGLASSEYAAELRALLADATPSNTQLHTATEYDKAKTA